MELVSCPRALRMGKRLVKALDRVSQARRLEPRGWQNNWPLLARSGTSASVPRSSKGVDLKKCSGPPRGNGQSINQVLAHLPGRK